MKKGQAQSREAKQLIREFRLKQGNPQLLQRGITKEMQDEAIAKGLRWCSGLCHAYLPSASFTNLAATKCRDCQRIRNARQRSKRTPEDVARLAAENKQWRNENDDYLHYCDLLKKYGVDREWYERKLAEQNGVCALCYSLPTGRRKRLCVDHHHGTNRVRGLLCSPCNLAISRLDAVDGWGEAAQSYVDAYK
jgi:hypothetical protein